MRVTAGIFAVMLAFAASPAWAVAGLDTVLDNVRRATGVAVLAEHGAVATGTAQYLENRVPYTLRIENGGRYTQSWAGAVPAAEGFDGETAWMHDMGGEIRHVRYGDLAQRELFGETLGHGWLQRGTSLELSLGETNAERVVVNFTRRGGHESGYVVIDAGTWLPVEWRLRNWGSDERYQLSGDLRASGLWLPRTITRTVDGTTETSTLDALVLHDAAVPSAPAAGMPADTAFDAGVAARLETARSPFGHILVRPLIEGEDLGWFIFDTGAGATVLDKRIVEDRALATVGRIDVQGVGGGEKASVHRLQELVLGPMTVRDHVVIGLDLSFLDEPMQRRIAGVIGYGVLARAIVEMDMQRGELALHDPRSSRYAELNWTAAVIEDRHPIIEGEYEGHAGVFRFDTGDGNGNIIIHPEAVKRHALLEGREHEPTRIGGVGGVIDARSGVLRSLRFAGREHENVAAIFLDGKSGPAHANPYIDGTIGGGLLQGLRFWLDYPNARVALVPHTQ